MKAMLVRFNLKMGVCEKRIGIHFRLSRANITFFTMGLPRLCSLYPYPWPPWQSAKHFILGYLAGACQSVVFFGLSFQVNHLFPLTSERVVGLPSKDIDFHHE
ncbi:Uncharacterized protein TCM_027214 [Theobroma cacao]|uniref:Uncharacterized protein n=1 Tax=Theobroma cacao TaxID=3641 RepID=A0A061GFM8_THECC|nr:Uncharacterized protein TCM_027214 [Theobroma cacao]